MNCTTIRRPLTSDDGPGVCDLRVSAAWLNRLITSAHGEAICGDVTDFDVMSQIALPLPVAVIGAWLGLEPDQCAALRDHSPAIIRLLGGFTDQEALDEGLAASGALIADYLPAAADRRAHPEMTYSACWPPTPT
jgi:cytochrome P450